MKPTLLILAAGIGSRYGGVKQMDQVGPSGESIIDYSVFDAIRAGFGKVVFVLNPKIIDEFMAIYEPRLQGKIETEYILQEISDVPNGVSVPEERIKPWGTAHAVLVAKDYINTPFAVINADDFYGANAFNLLFEFFQSIPIDSDQYAMVAYKLGNTLSDHGSVSRGICTVDNEDFLKYVVERTKIERIDNNIGFQDENNTFDILPEDTYVSMNFWGFTPGLFNYLEKGFVKFINKKENLENPKSEYFIPSVVTELIEGLNASVRVLKSHESWFGVTYKEDKETTIEKIAELVKEGKYPESLWG